MTVSFIHRLWQQISRWNIFESGSLDDETVRTERWSSWIYIILLIFVLLILSALTGLERQTATVTVESPSFSQFESLQEQYPETLRCPCSVAYNQWSTFVQINISFHQICSSPFIADDWIRALFATRSAHLWPMDARTVVGTYAQGLRILCEVNQMNVNTELNNYLSTFLTSAQALPASELTRILSESSVNRIVEAASGRLASASALLNTLVSADMALSGLNTNGGLYRSSQVSTKPSIAINTYQVSKSLSCYCLPTFTCLMPAAIYPNTASATLGVFYIDSDVTYVQGMETGCYPYDGLLSSTLECYYDPLCLEFLASNISTFGPLNASLPSSFTSKSTVNDVLATAMAESVSYNYSADVYYATCAPRFCVYSYEHRSTVLHVITKLIGIVGGLHKSLRLAIPILIRFLIKFWRKCRPSSSRTSSSIRIVSVNRPGHTFKQKMLNLCEKVVLINLFDSSSSDATILDRERKITRLFILLLVATSFALTVHVNLSQIVEKQVVDVPPNSTYSALQARYSTELECLCSNTNVRYREIARLNMTFHQICSSPFVSIPFLLQFPAFNTLDVHQYDFMIMSGVYFVHIKLFCESVKQYVSSTLDEYFQQPFIVAKLITPEDFEEKLHSDVMNRIAFAKKYISHAMLDALEFSSKSYGISALYTYFDMKISADGSITTGPSPFFNCSCITNPDTCTIDAAFYAYTQSNDSLSLLFKVTGMKLACSATRSTILSSFACWYSPACYEKVVSFWQSRVSDFNYTPPLLNTSCDKTFKTSDTLMDILQEAMINEVFLSTCYSDFHSKCAAWNCTYALTGRQHTIVIITNMMSIFSGLSVVVRLVTPLLFHMTYWLLGLARGHIELLRLICQIPQTLTQLNFFFKRRKSSPLTLQTEKRATRLYIVLWISIFTTLLLYNLFTEDTFTKEVAQPTEPVFAALYASYNVSLRCPCTATIFFLRSFVGLNVHLHQICASPFIESAWFENIFGDGQWSTLSPNQFRTRGIIFFVVQQSLCHSAQRAINLTIEEFLGNAEFTEQIISEEQLVDQTALAVDRIKYWNRNHFSSILSVLRGGLHINQLINIFFSNWIYLPQNSTQVNNSRFLPAPVSHGTDCSCAMSPACTEPMYVDNINVPGFVLGCNPIESLLRSTLSCLYNQTCLRLINFANVSSMHPLDSSISSQYHPNSTVDELVSGAFVEEWLINISYSKFFAACAPSTCTYSVSERKSVLDMITIMLGLYGGVTLILRVIVPRLVVRIEAADFRFRHRNARVVAFVSK